MPSLYGHYSVANKQTNGSVEQQYTENITKLFTFYKEQVDALSDEVEQLKTQIKDIENKYVKDINGYKVIVEKLEDEVEVLREENDELKIENAVLKGDKEMEFNIFIAPITVIAVEMAKRAGLESKYLEFVAVVFGNIWRTVWLIYKSDTPVNAFEGLLYGASASGMWDAATKTLKEEK